MILSIQRFNRLKSVHEWKDKIADQRDSKIKTFEFITIIMMKVMDSNYVMYILLFSCVWVVLHLKLWPLLAFSLYCLFVLNFSSTISHLFHRYEILFIVEFWAFSISIAIYLAIDTFYFSAIYICCGQLQILDLSMRNMFPLDTDKTELENDAPASGVQIPHVRKSFALLYLLINKPKAMFGLFGCRSFENKMVKTSQSYQKICSVPMSYLVS